MSENLIVSDGISGGATWATYRVKPNGSLKRVVSPQLPLRATREEAEADLRAWRRARLPVRFEQRLRRAGKYRMEAAIAQRKAEDEHKPAAYRQEMRELTARLLGLAEHEIELGREQDPDGAAEYDRQHATTVG